MQIGLYAAPLALIGYAMFGGSKLLIFGAAGSVAAVSASVVGGLSGGDQDTAVAMTAALALAAGAVFLVAGLAKMGWIPNFMSKAVMAGFITGMSIQIIVGQFGKLFGVEVRLTATRSRNCGPRCRRSENGTGSRSRSVLARSF